MGGMGETGATGPAGPTGASGPMGASGPSGPGASPSPGPFVTTIIVSPKATAAESGTALLAAMASITDSRAYLIKIEPGLFDIGTGNTLTSKPNVDIEGSGPEVTTITGSNSGAGPHPIVLIQDGVGLRNLGVSNTAAGGNASAVILNSSSAILQNLFLDASAPATGIGLQDNSASGTPNVLDTQVFGGPGGVGIVTNGGASTRFDRVTATGGTGVMVAAGFPSFFDCQVNGSTASFAITNSDPTLDSVTTTGAAITITNSIGTHATVIRDSALKATPNAIGASASMTTTLTVKIDNTEIIGLASSSGAGTVIYQCVDNFDSAFATKGCP
jgi:hypothetical protein